MIYEYHCKDCGLAFDVVKPYSEMENHEACKSCGQTAVRQFLPRIIHLSKTKVEHPEYNPGLGMVVKNAYHRSEICKEKNLIEVGNENVLKESERVQKNKRAERKKAWDDL